MKNKKHEKIYCLVPHHAKLNHLNNMYEAVVAWSKNYDDLCDYMEQNKTDIDYEIFVGNAKTFKKLSIVTYEDYEIVYVHNQWTPKLYANDLWELIAKERTAYNDTIGVIHHILSDEGTDKYDRKVLKKALQIIEEYRDMECDPVDSNTLQANHELNNEWRDHL